VTVDLTDPTLFGNDAAEDEREDIFYSYAFERAEVEPFADTRRPLCIAHAYKGEGKSALLRLTRKRVADSNTKAIVITRTADELAPEVTRDDPASWVRGWKASILHLFAVEIGSRIGFAWTDDTMKLVEQSEKSGFKGRSLLSAVLDRLKLPAVSVAGVKVAIPERRSVDDGDPQQAIKTCLRNGPELWLFVDDVDKNFGNTALWKLRVASFFDACRSLMNVLPELRVRTVVRPNVWTIVKLEYESMSHVQQYLFDLRWEKDHARQLVSKRIEAYLRRNDQWRLVASILRGSVADEEETVIAYVFETPMVWGGNERPPHVVLYTLSKHRPRWIIELCKIAATSAAKKGRSRVLRDDVTGELTGFGRRRIEDTVAEFRSRCAELDELISAFSREKEQLSTDELLKIIDNKILTHINPTIAGVSGKPRNIDVAAFLFEIGLFYARRELGEDAYEHLTFSDDPTLLRSRANLDQGVAWEIHPVFRQTLNIRDASGRETVLTSRRPNR
jgi:hypothetical protein